MKFYDQLINESAPGAAQAVPATTNVPEADYPRVYADGRVIFRAHFPSAQSVVVEGGQGLLSKPLPMSKDADGYWHATLPPAVQGLHYYWFNVDGVRVNDPGSSTFIADHKETSAIEIPDPQFISSDLVTSPVLPFYAPHKGPHGQLREHPYHSVRTGAARRCIVYTPPSYFDPASRDRSYPVLYLLHGEGEDETAWSRQGAANFILDNSILGNRSTPFVFPGSAAVKKASEMIVVMEGSSATYPKQVDEHQQSKSPPSSSTSLGQHSEALSALLHEEVIPMIDAAYRTKPAKEHRAIAGVGAGGTQALAFALANPDSVAYIGTFSGSQFSDPQRSFADSIVQAKGFHENIRLLWMGAGTAETEVNQSLRAEAKKLKAANIRLVEFHSPGTAHEWQTWRICLNKFAPLIFPT